MSRKMYEGGSSRKQAPRLAIREPDLEPPRKLKCGLVNGRRKSSWLMHASRMHNMQSKHY